ncbi:hypothetical protein J8273_5233 [Carpediemonas membranifera]|uniref:Clp1 P-loop domain-containing protein n=1 Tax=Carpediemonas membranifera TaxID=201153 RepID=A0A8J6ARN4_9EUKA|nr:hypothetical protein J8273_5233 [Carpediemonas membranifera]|eukprot:KAG9392248.1 hypothetical protein J8273_5233 [Carpediemonas membranifera]
MSRGAPSPFIIENDEDEDQIYTVIGSAKLSISAPDGVPVTVNGRELYSDVEQDEEPSFSFVHFKHKSPLTLVLPPDAKATLTPLPTKLGSRLMPHHMQGFMEKPHTLPAAAAFPLGRKQFRGVYATEIAVKEGKEESAEVKDNRTAHRWAKILAESDHFRVPSAQNSLLLRKKPKRPSIAVLGEVGAGKSSMVRILVNTLLNSADRVLLVDLDVGRPEFAPPGVMSVSIITQDHDTVVGTTEPAVLTGDPRQFSPALSVCLGDTHIQDCQLKFIACVQDLARRAEGLLNEDPAVPIVINTPGYRQGWGRAEICSALTSFAPTTLALVRRPVAEGEYDHDRAGFAMADSMGRDVPIVELPAIVGGRRLDPDSNRALHGAAYFLDPRRVNMQQYATGSLVACLREVAPFRVPWIGFDPAIKVIGWNGETPTPVDVLWRIVALETSSGVFVGLGLVRRVITDQHGRVQLVVATPADPTTASRLVLTKLEIPIAFHEPYNDQTSFVSRDVLSGTPVADAKMNKGSALPRKKAG